MVFLPAVVLTAGIAILSLMDVYASCYQLDGAGLQTSPLPYYAVYRCMDGRGAVRRIDGDSAAVLYTHPLRRDGGFLCRYDRCPSRPCPRRFAFVYH